MATAWCIWETWFIQPLLLLSYFLMEHKPSSIKYVSLNHLLQLPPCSAHIIHLFLILFPMCLTLHLFLWPYGFQGKSLSSYTIYNFYHNNVSYHKQARFLSQYMSCTMNKPTFCHSTCFVPWASPLFVWFSSCCWFYIFNSLFI